jgi:TetR/AcrR family transcriptional repressor of nem operon
VSGYDRWQAHISAGLAAMVASGELVPNIDVEWLAASTLASVQGGLVLTQARGDPQSLRRALDGALSLIGSYRPSS